MKHTARESGYWHSYNTYEMLFLLVAADRRQQSKDPFRAKNNRVDQLQTDFEMHLHGVMGEEGVGRTLGVQFDLDVLPGGDGKVKDLVYPSKCLRRDVTIQVKANMVRGTPNLYFNTKPEFKADIGVLAAIRSACCVELLGWVYRERWLKEGSPVNWGYGPRWGMTESKLSLMSCFPR